MVNQEVLVGIRVCEGEVSQRPFRPARSATLARRRAAGENDTASRSSLRLREGLQCWRQVIFLNPTVWTRGKCSTEWIQTSAWKANTCPVCRASWAPSKFGTVLATCSYDGTVAIWEERILDAKEKQSVWPLKAFFNDSRLPITDVKFAPEQFGLILATCSADGLVRFYEALDEKNVDLWIMQMEMPYKLRLSCLSWILSTTRPHSAFVAAGSDDSKETGEGGKIIILQYIEGLFRWETCTTIPEVTDAVHDVAFADIFGRCSYVLAVATNNVRLYHLKPLDLDYYTTSSLSEFSIELCAQFNEHHCSILRVAWNIPSIYLSALGINGIVHMWQCTSYNEINDQRKWDLIQNSEEDMSSIPSFPIEALTSPIGMMATSVLPRVDDMRWKIRSLAEEREAASAEKE